MPAYTEPPNSLGGSLGLCSADGDGKISREEWIAKYGSAEGFDQYDLDG